MAIVVVKTGRDPYRTTLDALSLLNDYLDVPQDEILIKPNLLSALELPLVNTDATICKAVVDFLKTKDSRYKFLLGEGATFKGTTFEAMKNNGFDQPNLWKCIDFYDSNISDWFKIYSPGLDGNPQLELGIADEFRNRYLVDVAKFKTHDVLGFTLGIKNMMGALIAARDSEGTIINKGPISKAYMHGFGTKRPYKLTREQNTSISKVSLTINIVRMAMILKNDFKLSIIDAMSCMEGNGPLMGCQKQMNMIICGMDPVAVDTVAAQIGGQEILYLKLCAKKGIGSSDIDKIEVLGENIESLRKPFEMHEDFAYSKYTDKEITLIEKELK